MALYSVWDWDRNAWQVYQTNKPASVGDDPVAHKPKGLSAIGADPDTGIKPLPRGAKFLRYDHLARGEVRRRPGSLTDVGDDAGAAQGGGTSTWWILAGGVAIGWAVSSWLKRRPS